MYLYRTIARFPAKFRQPRGWRPLGGFLQNFGHSEGGKSRNSPARKSHLLYFVAVGESLRSSFSAWRASRKILAKCSFDVPLSHLRSSPTTTISKPRRSPYKLLMICGLLTFPAIAGWLYCPTGLLKAPFWMGKHCRYLQSLQISLARFIH